MRAFNNAGGVRGTRQRRQGVVAATRSTVDDEVGVVDGLAEADEEVKDVRIVVQQRATLHIPAQPSALGDRMQNADPC